METPTCPLCGQPLPPMDHPKNPDCPELEDIHKVGSYLRYGKAADQIMQVDLVMRFPDTKEVRYYGNDVWGLRVNASPSQVKPATKEDLELWASYESRGY